MWNLLSHRSILLLVLVAAVAVAREREPVERTLILSNHLRDDAPRVKDGAVEMVVRVFRGNKKVAVTFHVTNRDPETSWGLGEARLTSVESGEARPFALRMDRVEISPGSSGTLAVVADKSAFASGKGFVDLSLELVRYDGLAQAVVLLDRRLVSE